MPATLLIVDETPANLSVLVDSLAGAGYRLLVAEDGEDAITQAELTKPDLILLDVMMPGLNGFETCAKLKASETTKDTPVIFMTALGDTSDKVKAFEAGAVDYVTKPFQQEEVISRVRAHLELRRLRRQLAEQLALRERFMRIAGHDLRNHLCLMLITVEVTEMWHRKGQALPKLDSQLALLTNTGNQMRNIIDTFLDLTPSNADASTSPSRCDINLVAEAVSTQYTYTASRKGIQLSLTLAQNLPQALSPSTLIFQAFTNYIGNAIKFTPLGGSVVVQTSLLENRIRAQVVDSGPGVPLAERSQLFVEHARLSPRPTGGEESHGIGLSIVKQLVESRGGRVGADFPPTGGSVFWFELPTA